MQANNKQRIIICGKSIFLSAIEAGLAALPELEVIHFHPHLPGAMKRIADLEPDMIVVEQNNTHSDLILALLNQNLSLVELDEAGQGTFLTGRKLPISDAEDMAHFLEQIVVTADDP